MRSRLRSDLIRGFGHGKAASVQIAVAGLAAAILVLVPTAPAAAAPRPNVLVINTDDQRARGTMQVLLTSGRCGARCVASRARPGRVLPVTPGGRADG
jgi:hypothetical protein